MKGKVSRKVWASRQLSSRQKRITGACMKYTETFAVVRAPLPVIREINFIAPAISCARGGSEKEDTGARERIYPLTRVGHEKTKGGESRRDVNARERREKPLINLTKLKRLFSLSLPLSSLRHRRSWRKTRRVQGGKRGELAKFSFLWQSLDEREGAAAHCRNYFVGRIKSQILWDTIVIEWREVALCLRGLNYAALRLRNDAKMRLFSYRNFPRSEVNCSDKFSFR